MDTREEILNQISNAFPSRIEFYHLGEVELQPKPEHDLFFENEIQGYSVVGFQLYGEINAFVIVIFPDNADNSAYVELGNILVSKVAHSLSSVVGKVIMTSPPQVLSDTQLRKLFRFRSLMARKVYIHLSKESSIPVEAWILPSSSEMIGYA